MDGRFTIPSRVYLDAERRDKLERLLALHEQELPDLLSALLEAWIDAQPAPPLDEPAPTRDIVSELRQRRGELRRLRARLALSDGPPPQWVTQLIADLEGEIVRLEQSR
jgi:hypothetical protein